MNKKSYGDWYRARKKAFNPIAGWSKIRSRIIERDGYVCRICGVDAVEGSLNVHHIDYNRSHNEPKNLVTLCATCHKDIHLEGYQPILYEDWPAPWGVIE